MFPLPFWRVFIRSTAGTRTTADSPQLFKKVWMLGDKREDERGKMKIIIRGKHEKEMLFSCQTYNKCEGEKWHNWNDKEKIGECKKKEEKKSRGRDRVRRMGKQQTLHPIFPFTLTLNLWPSTLYCICSKVMSQFKNPLCDMSDFRFLKRSLQMLQIRKEWKDQTIKSQ